jgi:hypothetical protein
VVQLPFPVLTGLFHKKGYLLEAWVIIYGYNHHVLLFSPERLVVDNQPSLLGSREPTLFMQSSGFCKFPIIRLTGTLESVRMSPISGNMAISSNFAKHRWMMV